MTLAHSSLFREIGIVILMISGSVVALFILNLKFVSVESFVMAQAISVGISMCGLGLVVWLVCRSFPSARNLDEILSFMEPQNV